MKTGILLVICSISALVQAYGQNFNMVILANRAQKILKNEKMDPTREAVSILFQNNKAPDELTSPGNERVPYFQKSKILPASNNYTFLTTQFHKKMIQYPARSRFVLTGLVMMAGSISYFLKSLRNRNEAGLNLTCQKISFGSSNKACKKVTSLTFAIPIGK